MKILPDLWIALSVVFGVLATYLGIVLPGIIPRKIFLVVFSVSLTIAAYFFSVSFRIESGRKIDDVVFEYVSDIVCSFSDLRGCLSPVLDVELEGPDTSNEIQSDPGEGSVADLTPRLSINGEIVDLLPVPEGMSSEEAAIRLESAPMRFNLPSRTAFSGADSEFVRREGEVIFVRPAEWTLENVLQTAIDIARDGDEIRLMPGHYFGTVFVDRSVLITASDSEQSVVLEGVDGPPIVWAASGGGLRNLSLRHFRGISILALDNLPTLYILDGAGGLFQNIGVSGDNSCIYVSQNASPTIRNSEIQGCHIGLKIATAGGLYEGNSIFQNSLHGVHIGLGQSPVLTDNRIFDNAASGIHVFRGRVILSSNTFQGNRSSVTSSHGAIVVRD
ncbi:MAG: right-handed parallel beta-helix repeat-containing protein [Pseudomonadota bacterium]